MTLVNTALLSYGMSGRVFHAPFIKAHSGFKLMGAWERSKKLIQSNYKDVQSFELLDDILRNDQIDLVIVNTPTNSHFEYAKQALLNNKHVVVEKAFTTTVDEALELKNLAASKKLKLSVFQNRRWDSDFLTVKQVVESGALGELVEVNFSFDRFNPGLSVKGHKENPGPGAGIVNDLGPHLIDQALYLFGMPQAVFADFMITRSLSKVEDYFEILLYYQTMRVRLCAGYFIKEGAPSYRVHGKKGSFLKSRADVQEISLQNGMSPLDAIYGLEPVNEEGVLNIVKGGVDQRRKISTVTGNYKNYYDGVYQSIIHNTIEPVTADDGIRTMKIIEAAFLSNSKNCVVELNEKL